MIAEDITVEQISRIRFLLQREVDQHILACHLCVVSPGLWLCADARCLLASMRYWDKRIATVPHCDQEVCKP
jgi:hypothetical protein